MKKYSINGLLFILMFVFPTGIMAQQPAWVDYAKRNSMYPQSEYITGFVSGHNSQNEDPGKLMDKYEEMAKAKVVQSIQVSIETNTSMVLSNVNGKSSEEFKSESASVSSATVTGLNVERYYDRKKNDVYAFAYVSKKELVYYNRKLIASNLETISEKLKEGKKYLASGDKQNALKSFYEGMPLATEAEQAQWLLLAIDPKQFVADDMKKIRNLKTELNIEISKLQQSKELNLGETAYFIAFGLSLQLGEQKTPLALDRLTFENTGLTSDFSDKWNTEIKNALIKAGNYQIKELKNAPDNPVIIKGNYWKEGDKLRIHVQTLKFNKLVAAAEGVLPVSWVNAEKINYVPLPVRKIGLLEHVKLQEIDAPDSVKIGKRSDQPVQVRVLIEKGGVTIPMENVPLIFSTVDGKTVARGISNSNGVAKAYFEAVRLPEGKTEIKGQIDLSGWAKLDTNSAYYVTAVKNNPVTPVIFTVRFVPQTYYITSEETLNNTPAQIKTIEPEIKNRLAKQGYHFVSKKSGADYTISIKAANTTGTGYQGVYFAYVDATLSVTDNASGDEVFKTFIEQVKGAGQNTKKATKKALITASGKLTEKLMEYLREK